jgi:hypothetical protein
MAAENRGCVVGNSEVMAEVALGLEDSTIAITRVKGSRSDVQSLDRHRGEPILDEVLALRTWLRERVEDGSRVLFPSQKGGAMTRMQFSSAVPQVRIGCGSVAGAGSPSHLAALALLHDGGGTCGRVCDSTAGRAQEHFQHDDLHACER